MDFVVIGLGLSALALLTGLTLLCLVAPRWFRRVGVAQPGDAAYARAQAGQRHALGQGFLCVGAVLLLTTLGGISAGLADKAGAYVIASMTTLGALGLLGWDLLYRRQHPIPARRRAASVRPKQASEATPDVPSADSPALSHTPTTTVRRRVLPARQRVVPAAQPVGSLAAPSVAPEEDVQRAVEEDRPGEATLKSLTGSAEPQVAASDAVTPDAEDYGTTPETRATADMAAGDPQEDAPETTDNEEPAVVEAGRPELKPLEPANTNGAVDPEASAPTPIETDVLPHGDDRVIALFPTAAARRSRTIVAPPDPDGQS